MGNDGLNIHSVCGPGQPAPLVSVIIPVYNVAWYLEKCIRSVTGQTYPRLEIILVDDGSTDGSGELCKLWARKDPRIRVIHTENRGLSAARNTGLRESRGAWISYIDPDDYVGRHFIERLLATALRTQAELVQCRVITMTMTASAADGPGKDISRMWKRHGSAPALIKDVPYISGREYMRRFLENWPGVTCAAWSRLYTRQAAEAVTFPEGRVYEDLATVQDFLYAAERISECRTACYYHLRLRPGSITSQMTFENYQDRTWALEHSLKRTLQLFPEYGDLLLKRKLWNDVLLWKALAVGNLHSDSPLWSEREDLRKRIRKHLPKYRTLGSFRYLQALMISSFSLLSGRILCFLQAHPGVMTLMRRLLGKRQTK